MEAAPAESAFSLSNPHQMVARPLLPTTVCRVLLSAAPDDRLGIDAPPATQVRSLTLDVKVWDTAVLGMMEGIGNAAANEVWEEQLQAATNK